MAGVAAKVYAFEPDPWTAARLRDAVADLPNVEVVEAAAGTREDRIPIYRSVGFEHNPELASLSTSAIAQKANVDPGSAIEARMIDFPAFLASLNANIPLIKVDIEGAEVDLLEALLDHEVADRIDRIFVETHELKIPHLADRSRALRRRVRKMARPTVNMDWR